MIELPAQLAVHLGTFITFIFASYAPIIFIVQCAKKKPEPHGAYKPGHLPTFVVVEFQDPEAKEADTYYSMKSEVAFPKKDKYGNVIQEGRRYNTFKDFEKVEEPADPQQPQQPQPVAGSGSEP
uniref:DUF1816 domain-containing protein n=1 Tax=Ascaris lumbricoides TaxID=6252 RepID=A0A0M3I4Y9_ASCLU